MDYDKNAIVKLDTDGSVLKCAKGAASADCGFEAGAKVCAKCGAMPMQMKAVPMDDEEMVDAEEVEEEMLPLPKKKKKPAQVIAQ